jgi:hypothetical protein
MLHTSKPRRLHRSRTLAMGLFFIALIALTGAAFLVDQGAVAAQDGPAATLPPGGTIPPGTLPPIDGPQLSGLINVLHLAPFDPDPANTAVLICNDADDSQVAGPLQYGEQSGYVELYLGEYDWYLAPAGAGCGTVALDLEPFTMFGGSKLSLVVFGGANGYPLESVLIVGVLGQNTQLAPLVRNQP